MTELTIQEELINNFGSLKDKIKIQKGRQLFVDADQNIFTELLEYVINKMGFNLLCTITGTDDGNNFGVLYHISQRNGILLNLRISAPKNNPVIDTIIKYFPSAEMYERELVDMFGIKVEGLPTGKRYPLPDDWPANQYPLRKEWKKEMLDNKGGN